MGRRDCQRWRGKRGVLTLWRGRELSFWERGGCRWHVAKGGRRDVSKGRERGRKSLHAPFAGDADPPTYCFCMPA